jgi:UDP-N-acetylmuramoyl-tripeptide--D-alanyl-D-alanine ligase
MTVLTAADIARRAGGRVEGDAGATVDVWSFDSRALSAGACFVALKGHRDGHDFVRAAFDAGAQVAIVSRPLDPGVTVPAGRALVHVDDTLVALQTVARGLRAERDGLRVVAVAGSTGKTSTKDLLAAALAPRGCHANAESYNNEFGLPITLCNAPDAAHVVVTEMGERFPGDLAALCAIAAPNIGVVTNVGLAHAEHLGGHAGTVAVLTELLSALPAEGFAVLPADDPFLAELAGATRAHLLTVGQATGADVVVEDLRVDDLLRPSFTVDGRRFTLGMHGAHHALNAAMAVAVAARAFAVPLADIAAELEGATGGKWRMELLESDDGIVVINDAYNANPTSMQAALVALARLAVAGRGRRIAVLGDMRELGSHNDDAHREVGEHAADLGLDVVVGVGSGGRLIADAAAARGTEVAYAADAGGAIEIVAALVRGGDAVLVKASRALGLEHVARELLAPGRHGHANCGSERA